MLLLLDLGATRSARSAAQLDIPAVCYTTSPTSSKEDWFVTLISYAHLSQIFVLHTIGETCRYIK